MLKTTEVEGLKVTTDTEKWNIKNFQPKKIHNCHVKKKYHQKIINGANYITIATHTHIVGNYTFKNIHWMSVP